MSRWTKCDHCGRTRVDAETMHNWFQVLEVCRGLLSGDENWIPAAIPGRKDFCCLECVQRWAEASIAAAKARFATTGSAP